MFPLAHRRILITRTRTQASDLAIQLEALGAEPILMPTIEIAPPEDLASLNQTLANLTTFDWLILTSANAVAALAQHKIPSTLKIAAIGPATAKALQSRGLHADLIPPKYVAESLAEALLPHAPDARMLLLRAAVARDYLPETLTAAGAHVTIAEAYRTVIPTESIAALKHLLADPTRHPHAVTFTSASTATNLAELLHAAGLPLPENIARASIGPVTTRTLRELNLPPQIEAKEATIPSLVEALAAYFATR